MAETKRRQYETIRTALEQERSGFLPLWRDVADYILPRRPRFLVTDTNKADRRSTKIIDNTATLAARTSSSGMMAGITSPAREWKRLTTPDPGMAEYGPVKQWLDLVNQRMSSMFLRSNLYNALPKIYTDMTVFGQGAVMAEEDFDDIIRFTHLPIGSYSIGVDHRGRVNLITRAFRMTVRNLVGKFGVKNAKGEPDWTKFSKHVKDRYDHNGMEDWIEVAHIIRPNPDHDDYKLDSKFKKFTSCYYESGRSKTSGDRNYMNDSNEDTYLRESGYDYFPVMVPRWQVNGEDSWATECPGIQCLGDIKQLQLGEKRIMQAMEKTINPPMIADPDLQNGKTSILPGDVNWAKEIDGNPKMRPLYQIDPRIDQWEAKQAQVRQRIQRGFYEDLFLMLANTERRDITAREIEERHEEKMLGLGPMLEQTNQDLLDPTVDISFDFMMRQSVDANGEFIEGAIVPEPPEELQGVNLKVEYVSVMAQAQKLVGVAGIERTVTFAINLAAATKDPTHLDKIDIDQTLDIYGDLTSVPPGIIRSDEAVQEMREARAKAQQEQQEAEELAATAHGARELAGAQLETKSALSELLKPAA